MAFQNTHELNAGKLGLNWEMLYKVIKPTKSKACKLATLDEQEVP